MKTNEGSIDRSVPILAGLVLIALTLSGTIGVWGWIGVVPVITGALVLGGAVVWLVLRDARFGPQPSVLPEVIPAPPPPA